MPKNSLPTLPALRPHTRAAAVAALVISTGFACADTPSTKITAILSNLPPHDSAAYDTLYAAAGRPTGEALDMTKSEVWPVPVADWAAFEVAAKRLGVSVTKLDATWNHALTPMQAGAVMTGHQQDMMHDAMTTRAAAGMSLMALPAPGIEEYALTKGMHDSEPAKQQTTLVIPLTSDITVTARRTSVAKTDGRYAWHGAIETSGEPVTLLWWPSGRMTGTATYHGRIYAIRALGAGMHAIVEMKPDALPQDHAPMPAGMREKMNMKTDPLVSKGDASMLMPAAPTDRHPDVPSSVPKRSPTRDQEDAAPGQALPGRLALAVPDMTAIKISPSAGIRPDRPVVIRVIVAYTAGAAKHYTEIKPDLIALAIEEANQSFRNSGIGNVELELAYTYQTTYVESGSHFEHVFRFANNNDGYMDEVHELRNKYAADVGLLIVDDGNGCGLAAEVYARPERAFAAVYHGCAINMYSVGHEIGHLIGARHDPSLDDSVMPFAYGHGFVNGKQWRTMMSYKDSCDGCMRLPLWSNPQVTVNGAPAGDATSNNARVIAEQAWRVASFR